MRIFSMRVMIAALALAAPAVVLAQVAPPPAVALVSKIQVVKQVKDAGGKVQRELREPTSVVPGDPLVVWLTYKNGSAKPASSFVVNNPIPNQVEFTGLGENSGWGVVSVDGGKTFGALAALRVTGKDGKPRAAIPYDVTHVRWSFKQPIAPGTGGTLSFYGVVK